MTQKPELGTCRTNKNKHPMLPECDGWQALPPSPQQVSGRRENKAVAASQGDDLKSSFAHNNERPESILGESGAGTLRDGMEKLIIAAVRLAIMRWDLSKDGEDIPEDEAFDLAKDVAWACQGEGTCDEDPIPEWDAVISFARSERQAARKECAEIARNEVKHWDYSDLSGQEVAEIACANIAAAIERLEDN